MDEYSSDTILSNHSDSLLDIVSKLPTSEQPLTNSSNSGYANEILCLRGHMNRILHLYTPTRAYARPHELTDLVLGLSTNLQKWYHSLPLEIQFPRDILTFNIHQSLAHASCVSDQGPRYP